MRPLHVGLLIGLLLCGTALPALATPSVAEPASDSGISIERVGTWYSPTNATEFRSAAAVRAGIQSGNFSRARTLPGNGTFLIALEITDFGTLLANTPGANTTERFQTVFERSGEFTVEQMHPITSNLPIQVHVLDAPGVRVLTDRANDSYYVVVDLGRVRATRYREEPAELEADDDYQYDVRLSLDRTATGTAERQRGGAVVGPREATVETAADGNLHVQVGRTLSVSGTTNVGTGQNLTVVLRGSDDPTTERNESLRRQKTITVGQMTDHHHYQNRFRAGFAATPKLAATQNLTVTVRFDGRTLLSDPVSVVVNRHKASVTATGLSYRSGVPAVRVNASLSAGGFLVLHEGSADGPVVGHSPFLASGTHERLVFLSESANVSDLVVVAHRDVNHNQWFDETATDRQYPRGVVTDETRSVTAASPTVSVENLAIWRTARSATTFETPEAVQSSIGAGNLSRPQNLSGNGTVVIAFELPGFDSLLARTNGTNTTRDFQQAIRRFGDLDFTQTNPPAQIAPVVFTLLDDRGVRVLSDTANGTYYMLVDLRRVGTVYESSDATSIAPRARFRLTLSFDGSVTATNDETVAEAFVPPHRLTIEESDRFSVVPGQNFTVTGTANFVSPEGEGIQVVLRGKDDPDTPANESVRRTVSVSPDSRYDATDGSWQFTAVFERTGPLRDARNVTVRARETDGPGVSDAVPVEVEAATPAHTETPAASATPTATPQTATRSPTDRATSTPTATAPPTATTESAESGDATDRTPVAQSVTPTATTGSTPGLGVLTGILTLLVVVGLFKIARRSRDE